MTFSLFWNWCTSVKYFITFEEITKTDLDNYFDKINREKHLENGIEWSTAQLGHFWIEWRIKYPNEYKESEENRLKDDYDENEAEEQNILKFGKWLDFFTIFKLPGVASASNVSNDSVSNKDDDSENSSENSPVSGEDQNGIEVFEDNNAFENFKKSKTDSENQDPQTERKLNIEDIEDIDNESLRLGSNAKSEKKYEIPDGGHSPAAIAKSVVSQSYNDNRIIKEAKMGKHPGNSNDFGMKKIENSFDVSHNIVKELEKVSENKEVHNQKKGSEGQDDLYMIDIASDI